MSLYFVCIQFRRMHFFVDNFMRNDLLGALSATPMITKRMSVPYRTLVSSRAVTRVVFFGRMLLFEEKFSTNGVLIVACSLACSVLNNKNCTRIQCSSRFMGWYRKIRFPVTCNLNRSDSFLLWLISGKWIVRKKTDWRDPVGLI
jgi:hypothetical protein